MMIKEVPIMSMSLSQLAEKLGVSARTVKRHIEKVETKYAIATTVKKGSHVLIKPDYESLVIASIQGLDLPTDANTPVSVVEPSATPETASSAITVVAELIDEVPTLAPVRRPELALVATDMEAYDRSTDEHIAALSRNFATMDAAFMHIARNEAKKTLARMGHAYVEVVSNGMAGLTEDIAS